TVAQEARGGGRILSIGNQWHMVNSGWIRLLAPTSRRFVLEWPGRDLPLPVTPDGDLSFLVYPRQQYYLPYLAEVVPGGSLRETKHHPDVTVLNVYRVPREKWAETQGALALGSKESGSPVRVARLGEKSGNATAWSALLRSPVPGNACFRAGPGPARLTIDEVDVLDVPA